MSQFPLTHGRANQPLPNIYQIFLSPNEDPQVALRTVVARGQGVFLFGKRVRMGLGGGIFDGHMLL